MILHQVSVVSTSKTKSFSRITVIEDKEIISQDNQIKNIFNDNQIAIFQL